MNATPHITDIDLEAFVDSRVTGGDHERIKSHLRSCAECHARQLEAVKKQFGPPPPGSGLRHATLEDENEAQQEPAQTMAERGYAGHKTTMPVLANIRDSYGDVRALAPLGVDMGYHVGKREIYVRLWGVGYSTLDWSRAEPETSVWFFRENIVSEKLDRVESGTDEFPQAWQWKDPQIIFKAELREGWHVQNEIGACRPRVDFRMRP